jgi:hypothetical protein
MDLTPVRTVYFEDMNTEVGDFDQVHRCRDISKLREFMDDRRMRNAGGGDNDHDLDEVKERKRLGYPDTEENLRPWAWRDGEFE